VSKKDKKHKSKGKQHGATPVWAHDGTFTKALVVVAHPDDVDYGAAGTVARLTDAGIAVSYCLVTSGDAGGDKDTRPRDERAAEREREQTAAAALVGVTDLHFLRVPDGTVEPTLALRKAITRVVRLVQPDLVLCQNPERNWERMGASHPDHLAAGEATVRALYPDVGNPHAYPELLDEGHLPHKVKELWLMSTASPTLVVDTTTTIDRKIQALACHASQIADMSATEQWVRGWSTTVATANGLPEGSFAEGFRRVAL
jgi:LmbE family N-acetylglucosaminyl deacetylase